MSVDGGWVPAACTLPIVERPLRAGEFDGLFAEALVGLDRVAPTHLRLSLTGGEAVAERARDLTARESECCSFFAFAVTASGDQVDVHVTVPAAHSAVLDALAARAARVAA